ncbi:serine/threonine-protein kinase [Actinomadura parmotrematis]|uniref:Serine/threonine protein kinase n=1 Tax=Actinomadura parmotrematis TaxID=2864039 RepID=A0ABS7G1W5_9ACTN|nr:serine/threonine-protein kinase [Actinomadura parmotrematis]MBW8485832.1 serine/threonine protein kinase [Actinomadura parmotrematis]
MKGEQEARTPRSGPLMSDDPASIGAYRLLGRLGEGGMGSVYLGLASDGQRVAIKVIRPELVTGGSFRARFDSEITNARRVASFCTARVLDHGDTDGHPYLVTEYIDGPSLGDHVEASGPLPPEPLQALAVGVAAALIAIHAVRLVHRDLKPRNVMLAPDGPRVIDFGIARALDTDEHHTRTGGVVGSPGWIAPEQYFDGVVSPAADVFAWGSLIAYAATGRHPYGSGGMAALAQRARQAGYDVSGVPGKLQPLVRAALEPDPARRPTADGLLAGLLGTVRTGQNADEAAATAVHTGWQDLRTATADASPTPETREDASPLARRRMPTWLLSVLSAAVTAVVVGAACVGVVLLRDDGGAASAAPPRPSPAVSSAASAEPPVTKVADVCGLLSAPVMTAYLPQSAVNPSGGGDTHVCAWTTAGVQDADGMENDRYLQVKVTVHRDAAGRAGAARAADAFAEAERKERGRGDSAGPGDSYGPVETVRGLGDEAFAGTKLHQGDGPAGVGAVVVRRGNVLLDVRYAGADYPPRSPSKSTALDPQKAKAAATAITGDLLRALSACRDCHS